MILYINESDVIAYLPPPFPIIGVSHYTIFTMPPEPLHLTTLILPEGKHHQEARCQPLYFIYNDYDYFHYMPASLSPTEK